MPIDKPALYHPPTDDPLQPSQDQKREKVRFQRSWNIPAPEKPKKRQRKDQSDQPAPEPMDIPPPENDKEAKALALKIRKWISDGRTKP